MAAEEAIAEAQSLREKGEYDAAWSILSELQESYPDSAAIHVLLGDTLAKLGRWVEATHTLARAVELAPASEMASLALFHLLWRRGKQIEALEEMKRFLREHASDDYSEILKEISRHRHP